MKITEFAMETASLAGSLPGRLRAIREAGFSRVMLSAGDLVGHAEGLEAAVALVRASGLRVVGLQELRDFEGLSGASHAYKVDLAKSMIEMCSAMGCKVLLARSSTMRQAATDKPSLVRDLRKLATLAIPHGVQVAYEALPWGCAVNRLRHAMEVVEAADCANLGYGLNSLHIFAAKEELDELELFDPLRICAVQLSDFLWHEAPEPGGRDAEGRSFRVFPGEGVHGQELAQLVKVLDNLGYRGGYSFDVVNDDYRQLPLPVVAARAQRAALWLAEDVLQRMVPLSGTLRLREPPTA